MLRIGCLAVPVRRLRRTFFEWVEVESYELEPPCTMINNTSHTFDLVVEARRRGWCEHELMYHIFEFGVPEGLRSMEAHMKALASVGEGSESVLQGRRILELAAEEDEANSVVFLGGVLQEDNSVNESSSSSWQCPSAASGEINMWNTLLSAMADVVAGPVQDDMVSEVDMGRVALTCHCSLDVLWSEMHQPHVFLPQVLSLDVLIPVNEVRKPCGIPEPAKSVQILFRGAVVLEFGILRLTRLLRSGSLEGRVVGIWMGTFPRLEGGSSIRRRRFAIWVWGIFRRWFFIGGLLGVSFAGMGQGGSILGTGKFGQWTCSNCGKSDCWSTKYSCYRCGCPRYFDAAGVGQVHSGGQGKGGGVAGFLGEGVGGGMSGV